MSDAPKKDLTGLMDYAKALEESGQAPPIPEGSLVEEQRIEKIENFENLEDYGKSNPIELPAIELSPETDPGMPPTENAAPADASVPPLTFETTPGLSALDLTPPPEPDQPLPIDEPQELLRPAVHEPAAPKAPLEKLRQFSEQLSPAKNSVPASYPFSLMITGRLAPEEKERLVDLLSRENIGVREMDLEPQFESGKILIPRISEYAGVLIIGALRSARVKMRMGPSDSIFATADTQSTLDEADFDSGARESSASGPAEHEAEELPITAEPSLPGQIRHAVVDIVTASAALKTLALEAEHSPEYQLLLEALQRELKYKAFRKGATAIVGFSVQLTQLHMPMHYRVLVSGSAIKSR